MCRLQHPSQRYHSPGTPGRNGHSQGVQEPRVTPAARGGLGACAVRSSSSQVAPLSAESSIVKFPSTLAPGRTPAARSRGELQRAPSGEGPSAPLQETRPQRGRRGGAFSPLPLSTPPAPVVAVSAPPPLETGAVRPRRRHRRHLRVQALGPRRRRHEAAGAASEADLAARDARNGAHAGAAA